MVGNLERRSTDQAKDSEEKWEGPRAMEFPLLLLFSLSTDLNLFQNWKKNYARVTQISLIRHAPKRDNPNFP